VLITATKQPSPGPVAATNPLRIGRRTSVSSALTLRAVGERSNVAAAGEGVWSADRAVEANFLDVDRAGQSEPSG
jgi:hypothetical protein